MKNYTAKEAIELARENPALVFVARDGDMYNLNALMREWNVDNTGNYLKRISAPFTAHRLVPADTPDIGEVLDELDDFIEEKAIWKDDYQYIPERSLYRELQKLRKKYEVKE